MESILLEEGSVADGKNPLQLDLAEKTGVMIIAIKRGESLFLHRLAEKTLEAGDCYTALDKWPTGIGFGMVTPTSKKTRHEPLLIGKSPIFVPILD